MQNISFMLTEAQVRARAKGVTRRIGWRNAKPVQLLRGCRKCMGLKRGEQIEPLCIIRVTNVRFEPLRRLTDDLEYGFAEIALEGFANHPVADTLAPILHWRVCNVWDWLFFYAPKFTGLPTHLVAEAYGGDKAIEAQTRTGCVGCPVASRDLALENIVENPVWAHLRPLLGLRDLYEELRLPRWRVRKDGSERSASGDLVRNPCRMGPLTFEGRRYGLQRVLEIQDRVNTDGSPGISLINDEEISCINALIAANTWPDKWTGQEPRADLPYEKVFPDGSVQQMLDLAEELREPQIRCDAATAARGGFLGHGETRREAVL